MNHKPHVYRNPDTDEPIRHITLEIPESLQDNRENLIFAFEAMHCLNPKRCTYELLDRGDVRFFTTSHPLYPDGVIIRVSLPDAVARRLRETSG